VRFRGKCLREGEVRDRVVTRCRYFSHLNVGREPKCHWLGQPRGYGSGLGGIFLETKCFRGKGWRSEAGICGIQLRTGARTYLLLVAGQTRRGCAKNQLESIQPVRLCDVS
jgi:hypothetical protein